MCLFGYVFELPARIFRVGTRLARGPRVDQQRRVEALAVRRRRRGVLALLGRLRDARLLELLRAERPTA